MILFSTSKNLQAPQSPQLRNQVGEHGHSSLYVMARPMISLKTLGFSVNMLEIASAWNRTAAWAGRSGDLKRVVANSSSVRPSWRHDWIELSSLSILVESTGLPISPRPSPHHP